MLKAWALQQNTVRTLYRVTTVVVCRVHLTYTTEEIPRIGDVKTKFMNKCLDITRYEASDPES